MSGEVLLRSVEVTGFPRPQNVRVANGVVADLGEELDAPGARVIDGAGGALLPGLHDHHVHLLASAAARESVSCGPPEVRSEDDLGHALAAAPVRRGWIRGTGYDEAVAGNLDRYHLDRLRGDVPVRVQHRSGALWVVNSAGVDALRLSHVDGVERDPAGVPTGRLWRLDGLIRDRLGRHRPDLGALGDLLASYGITGVTDATPELSADGLELLATELPQRVVTLAQDVTGVSESVTVGPYKVVVADHALPGLDELAELVRRVRPRAVAVHCVTREALLLTLAALREVGPIEGDRIEHAAVVPEGIAAQLAALRLTVVTQPSLLGRRGDDYLDRVAGDDLGRLWPFRTLLEAGVRVGCSSDAPYGSLDPWESIARAVDRRTPSGRVVTDQERVTAEQALSGFLSGPMDPGGPPRPVGPGVVADLVLLDRSRAAALARPVADAVRMTLIGGSIRYERPR